MKIFTFTKPQVTNWEIENDTVMGGRSSSRIQHVINGKIEMMRFSGHVSLENGGGFAQTQHVYRAPLDLSSFNGVVISGDGDGKTYTLRFETKDQDVSYQAEFTASENFSQTIGFDDLKKVHHGKPVPYKPDFDKSNIHSICILIGNGVEEDFEITINSIVAAA